MSGSELISEKLTIYRSKIARDFASVKKPRPLIADSRKKTHVRGCERELEEGLERIQFLEKIAGWGQDNQIIGNPQCPFIILLYVLKEIDSKKLYVLNCKISFKIFQIQ